MLQAGIKEIQDRQRRSLGVLEVGIRHAGRPIDYQNKVDRASHRTAAAASTSGRNHGTVALVDADHRSELEIGCLLTLNHERVALVEIGVARRNAGPVLTDEGWRRDTGRAQTRPGIANRRYVGYVGLTVSVCITEDAAERDIDVSSQTRVVVERELHCEVASRDAVRQLGRTRQGSCVGCVPQKLSVVGLKRYVDR